MRKSDGNAQVAGLCMMLLVLLIGLSTIVQAQSTRKPTTSPAEKPKPADQSKTSDAANISKEEVDKLLKAGVPDFKGAFETVDGKLFARLTWNPEHYSTLWKRYRITADLRRVKKLNELPEDPAMAKGNILVELPTPGRSYIFWIRVETDYPTEVHPKPVSVTIRPEGITVSSVDKLKVTLDKDQKSIHLTWTYPGPEPIIGYRVTANGKQIASEDDIKADATQWTTPPMPADKICKITIRAVGTDGGLSDEVGDDIVVPR